eukprot:11181332-Lingulodinium_polyedra.AAC.1
MVLGVCRASGRPGPALPLPGLRLVAPCMANALRASLHGLRCCFRWASTGSAGWGSCASAWEDPPAAAGP